MSYLTVIRSHDRKVAINYYYTSRLIVPNSLRQPHASLIVSELPVHAPITSSHSVNSPLSPSITPSFISPQNLPLSQIFSTVDSLPAAGLTPWTLWQVRFFWASRFFVFSFLHYSFWFREAD